MDEIEKNALELVQAKVSAELDPFPVLKELLDRHIIDDDQHSLFLQDAYPGKSNKVLWYRLLEYIQKYCSFLTLIDILMKTGHAELAQTLLDLIKRGDGDRRIARVHKIHTDNQKSIRLFFKNLKSQVHDARFGNPREALRLLANSFHDKIRREVNAPRKLYLVDKLVAILGVEIDAHAITFDDNLSSHGLFDELKSLVHDSSNTMMTDVSYYGRLANANAIGGRFSEGKDMLMKAQCSASNFTTCLEVANMYYIQVYVLLWEFEATYSQELKQSLLEMAAKGIASLQEEDDEIRILWTRMFLLRMIFCLLGIGNRANILPCYSPSQEDVRQALHLLQKMRWDGIWKGIETRREMFYWMAMSRLNALTGDITEAQSNVFKAWHLARTGKFREETFIDSYSKELECAASYNSHEVKAQKEHWHPENTPMTRSNSGGEISFSRNFHEYYCSLSKDTDRLEGVGSLDSYTWRVGLSGNLNVQNSEEENFHLYQNSNRPGDFEGRESYTWRIGLSGNLNAAEDEEGSRQLQQVFSHSGELDVMESHAWITSLSDNSSLGEGSMLLQQINGEDRFCEVSDDGLACRSENHAYSIANRYDSCVVCNTKQHLEVYPDSEVSSTDVISPYNSSSVHSTFACSYLHRRKDDDVEQPSVYLYHHATAKQNDTGATDDDCRKNELMIEDVATTMRNIGDEHLLLKSSDFYDDPYSSVDSVQLYGSGIHGPVEPLNSLVLFEDRSEPDGNSAT